MTTPAQPSDPQKHTASTAGGPFSYTDEGDGPVLLGVHGLPGSVRDFRWLAAALPPGVRFIRLDLPGFGATPLKTDPATHVDARGAFVLRALEALNIKRAVVLGHSMGGPVAISAAVQDPARITGLALLASVGVRPHHVLRRMVGRGVLARGVDVPVLGAVLSRVMFQSLRAVGFPPTMTLPEAAQTLRIVGRLDFAALTHNVRALNTPTLAAYAKDDPFIEPPITQQLWEQLPAGPRLWLEDGGHNIQKGHAVELGQALAAFVEQHANGALR